MSTTVLRRLQVMGMLILLIVLSACSFSDAENGSEEASRSSIAILPATPYASAGDCKPEGVDGVWTFEEYRQAVACSAGQFEWPAMHYPDFERLLAPNPDANVARFQIGMEYSTLSGTNECAWFSNWLDARASGDTGREAQALEYMTTVIPNFGTLIPGIPSDLWDPPDRSGFARDLIEPAQLGDASGVQNYVQWNCVDVPWISAP